MTAAQPDLPRYRSRRQADQIDDLDLAILGHLQEDGRRSFRQIAADLGLTEGAIRQRFNRMKELGILRVSGIVDPNALGVRLVAEILIKAVGDLDDVADALAEVPEIEYVVITLGSFDLFAEVVCESTDHLLDVLNTKVRTVEGIVGVEALMHLKIRKQVFEWVTPLERRMTGRVDPR